MVAFPPHFRIGCAADREATILPGENPAELKINLVS
jgi:hypothetical protein